jgi:histidine triad (HIT) family protein
MAPSCVFCDIIKGKVDANRVFEDRLLVAFHDRHPQAPTHLLILPKRHIRTLAELPVRESSQKLLGRMMLLARRLASDLSLDPRGYRLVLNSGDDAGQAVPHLHLHLLAGRTMQWPPG